MSAVASERDNRQWLSDLRADGVAERRDRALLDLSQFLRRGLGRNLARKGVSRESVEDFVQEAMLKIMDRLDEFRGESLFTTWAMSIAVRVAFTEMRRARFKDRSLDQILGDQTESSSLKLTTAPDIEDSVHRRQIKTAMAHVLSQLNSRQQTVLLGELKGVPKSILADRLGTNTNALYKSSHDARQKLRQGLLATGLSESEIRAAFSP